VGRFEVPEYTDEGVKKSELTGESAKLTGGIAEITGFTIRFYEMGTTNVKMKVSAPECAYDQRRRLAKSPTAVRIEAENMVVTGEDFAWDGSRELFKIFKNAKVVISNVRTDSSLELLSVEGDSDDE
jgi:hypothetical protein